MDNIEIIILSIAAYLFGSISSAIIVCKIAGLPDPRLSGSKNPGATNVLRIGGKKTAAITLLGDVLKGFIPVMIASYMEVSDMGLAIVAFFAFIGHLFPIFFRFEGGKGVATFIGCLFALSWPAATCWLATWLFVALIFRYSSLSALVACLLAPFYIWAFSSNEALTISTSIMSLILIYRHRSNIANLAAGKEFKIGQR